MKKLSKKENKILKEMYQKNKELIKNKVDLSLPINQQYKNLKNGYWLKFRRDYISERYASKESTTPLNNTKEIKSVFKGMLNKGVYKSANERIVELKFKDGDNKEAKGTSRKILNLLGTYEQRVDKNGKKRKVNITKTSDVEYVASYKVTRSDGEAWEVTEVKSKINNEIVYICEKNSPKNVFDYRKVILTESQKDW